MSASKKLWLSTCEKCSVVAQWRVVDHYGREQPGVYCWEHAEELVQTLDTYQKYVDMTDGFMVVNEFKMVPR